MLRAALRHLFALLAVAAGVVAVLSGGRGLHPAGSGGTAGALPDGYGEASYPMAMAGVAPELPPLAVQALAESAERQTAAAVATRAAAQRARALAAAEAARKARAGAWSAAQRSARADPRPIARLLAAERGWGAGQFSCLDALWAKESGWDYRARNPYSGAYGLAQALPGSKMSTVGADWSTNPITQIRWGLGYIASRYGAPCAAWAHSQAHNWY